MLESMGCALYPHALKMDEIYWDTLIEAATPSDGAVELLHQLKQQGLRIGIGTDMTARIQLRKLTELGMLPYVDFLVSSEEAGVEKPAPEFFARCVAKAGCESRECLFIGDNLKKDVFGALNAGWKAVWYCPEGAQMGDDILQIANFAQLPELLGKL
jgi:putative hydrolase of the HAD superfamily